MAGYLGLHRSSIARIEGGETIAEPVGRLLAILVIASGEDRVDQLLNDVQRGRERFL